MIRIVNVREALERAVERGCEISAEIQYIPLQFDGSLWGLPLEDGLRISYADDRVIVLGNRWAEIFLDSLTPDSSTASYEQLIIDSIPEEMIELLADTEFSAEGMLPFEAGFWAHREILEHLQKFVDNSRISRENKKLMKDLYQILQDAYEKREDLDVRNLDEDIRVGMAKQITEFRNRKREL